MRDSSKRKRKWVAPLVCAAVVLAFLIALLGLVLLPVVMPLLGIGTADGAAMAALGLYALVLLAVIVGVVVALVQRLREIQKGEEEDAKKY